MGRGTEGGSTKGDTVRLLIRKMGVEAGVREGEIQREWKSRLDATILLLGEPGMAEEIQAKLAKGLGEEELDFWERVVPLALRNVPVARADAAVAKAVGGSKGLKDGSRPQHRTDKGGGGGRIKA